MSKPLGSACKPETVISISMIFSGIILEAVLTLPKEKQVWVLVNLFAKLIGVFGRINYNWKNLLIASASIRYEGSTKFGADHKWGAFPSLSLAWEMANMGFLKDHQNIVQSLKPRVSYGVTGRSDFDCYQSLATRLLIKMPS